MAGPQEGHTAGSAETVPSPPPGHPGNAGLSSPHLLFGSSCLCSWDWPHLAGSPLSSLGNQGSLCVQTPSIHSLWQLLDRRHTRRGRLPGRVRSEPDTSHPDEQFPEETPQEPATALSTGPHICLGQATWGQLQEVPYSSEGYLWG